MAHCNACGNTAVVQWSRRPSDAEMADICNAEQNRRDQILAAADPNSMVPQFGPLPAACETLIAVYACVDHAISLESASMVHAATCAAPPVCGCTPEPIVISPNGGSGNTPPAAMPAGW